MRTFFTPGSHLPAGDMEHRIMISGMVILLLALLIYLLGLVISAPHNAVIS